MTKTVVIRPDGTASPNPVHVSKSAGDIITWQPSSNSEVSFENSPFAPAGQEDDYVLIMGSPKNTPSIRADAQLGTYSLFLCHPCRQWSVRNRQRNRGFLVNRSRVLPV